MPSAIVNRSTRYKAATEKSDKLAFNASGPARELPFETYHGVASKAEATPEPGKYDPKVTEHGKGLTADADSLSTHNANAKKGTAAFMVTSPGHGNDLATKQMPSTWGTISKDTDPGAYNPNVNREIEHDAKKTFQTRGKKGEATFGGTNKRELKLSNSPTHPPKAGFHGDVEDTPGAGTYNPLMTETGHEYDMWVESGSEKMKSASFATKTQRPTPVLPSWKNPGPAEYQPNPLAVEPEVGNKMSKVGRKSKYTGDHIDGGAEDSTTTSIIGPGSYNPIRNKSGEMDTIELQMAEQLDIGFGTNASVTSSSFRTMFMQWLGIQ